MAAVRIVAHRGNRVGAPENTWLAFEQALALGSDGIETDVRVSRDGVAVLFHDEDLTRMAGRDDRIEDLSAAELSALDLGTSEGVPTLEAFLSLCRDRGRVILDLKVDGALSAIEAAVRASGFREELLTLCAWTTEQATEVRRSGLAGARLARLTEEPLSLEDFAGYDALSLRQDLVDAETVARAHRRGLEVTTWTVNDPLDFQRVLRAGVDTVITDDPAALLRLRG